MQNLTLERHGALEASLVYQLEWATAVVPLAVYIIDSCKDYSVNLLINDTV